MVVRTTVLTIRTAAFGVASTIVMLSATHATADGLYLSAVNGLSLSPDSKATATVPPSTVDGDLEYDIGFQGQFAVGYAIDDFRVELEGSYARNRVSKVRSTDSAVTTTEISVDTEINVDIPTFSANAYWDLPVLDGVRPYLGAGVGYSPVIVDSFSVTDSTGATLVTVTDPDLESVISFQVIAGVAVPITDNIVVGGEYRYVGSENINLSDGAGNSVDIERSSHQFGVVFRYHFGSFGGRPSSIADSNQPPPGSDTIVVTRATQTQRPPPPPPRKIEPEPEPIGQTVSPASAAGAFTYRQLPAQAPRQTLADLNAGRAQPLNQGFAAVTPTPPTAPPRYSGSGAFVASTPRKAPKNFGLHLASFREIKIARKVWPFVRKQYKNLLGNPKLRIKREEVPGQGKFHNLYAYGYSVAEAQRLCQVLRTNGVVCNVGGV